MFDIEFIKNSELATEIQRTEVSDVWICMRDIKRFVEKELELDAVKENLELNKENYRKITFWESGAKFNYKW